MSVTLGDNYTTRAPLVNRADLLEKFSSSTRQDFNYKTSSTNIHWICLSDLLMLPFWRKTAISFSIFKN